MPRVSTVSIERQARCLSAKPACTKGAGVGIPGSLQIEVLLEQIAGVPILVSTCYSWVDSFSLTSHSTYTSPCIPCSSYSTDMRSASNSKDLCLINSRNVGNQQDIMAQAKLVVGA